MAWFESEKRRGLVRFRTTVCVREGKEKVPACSGRQGDERYLPAPSMKSIEGQSGFDYSSTCVLHRSADQAIRKRSSFSGRLFVGFSWGIFSVKKDQGSSSFGRLFGRQEATFFWAVVFL